MEPVESKMQQTLDMAKGILAHCPKFSETKSAAQEPLSKGLEVEDILT